MMLVDVSYEAIGNSLSSKIGFQLIAKLKPSGSGLGGFLFQKQNYLLVFDQAGFVYVVQAKKQQ